MSGVPEGLGNLFLPRLRGVVWLSSQSAALGRLPGFMVPFSRAVRGWGSVALCLLLRGLRCLMAHGG